MKHPLLFIFILISTISIFAQTEYEAGYIIMKNNQKIDCLIKNEDWKGSPTTFNYKLEVNGEEKIGNISNISEFGSENNFKYVVATVNVDQSDNKVDYLSEDRNPILKEETLFLKVLVEGKASLFYTLKGGYSRFFYSMDYGKIEQLIHKRYLITNGNIAENNRYKQQLASDFMCANSKEFNFEKLEYKKSSLIRIFENYNSCENASTIVYNHKNFKYGFNLTLRPGITFSSASLQKSGKEKLDFDEQTSIRIGLEAEYILPFNNGKWSLFIEPTYRNYKGEKEAVIFEEFPTLKTNSVITVSYNSIELPFGARYYMFLGKDAAIFLNGAAVIDLSILDSEISSAKAGGYNLDFSSETTAAFGAGFKFKDKYSLEARYYSPKKITNYVNVTSSFHSFSLIAGYNFL